MRRLVGSTLALASVLLAACQPSNSASVNPSATRKAAAIVQSAPPSATDTPTPIPALSVAKVGAVATPTGFLAFVLISNPSSETASEVTIDMAEMTAGGQTVARRSGTINAIAPGNREALALSFPLGRSLPSQFTATITGTQWSVAAGAVTPLITAAAFLQDARTPTVRLHLVDQASRGLRLNVVAICWDAAGNIRGGGSRTVTLSPDPQGQDAAIPVAVSAIPAHCDGYGFTIS